MLISRNSGNAYLVSDKPRQRRTGADEIELFKKMASDEKEIYRQAFSYYPLGLSLTKHLKLSLLSFKENSPKINHSLDRIEKLFESYKAKGSLNKRECSSLDKNVDKLTNEFRMLEAPREWMNFVISFVANNKEILKQDEYDFFFDYTNEKEYQLWCNQLQKSMKAIRILKNDFLQDNIGLIGAVINRRYMNGLHNMSHADLQQEGCFGLIKAINKFDYTRGLKFSTYSAWWIRHALTRALYDKDKTIRIPVHIQSKVTQIKGFQNEHIRKFGTSPTVEFMAKELGFTNATVLDVLEMIKVTSLDSVAGTLSDSEDWYSIIEDTTIESPIASSFEKESKKEITGALNILNDRELLIIKNRFGLDDNSLSDDTQTLKEIGDVLNLSRERIRQIENFALKKMREHLKTRLIESHSDIALSA